MNRARTTGLRALVEIVRASGWPYEPLERRAGINIGSLARWQKGIHGANLTNAEAVAEVLGYELQWVKKNNAPSER